MFGKLQLLRFILILLCNQSVENVPREERPIEKGTCPPRVPRRRRKEYCRRIAPR